MQTFTLLRLETTTVTTTGFRVRSGVETLVGKEEYETPRFLLMSMLILSGETMGEDNTTAIALKGFDFGAFASYVKSLAKRG